MELSHFVDVAFNVIVFAFIGVTIGLYLRSEDTDADIDATIELCLRSEDTDAK